ncbi:MAG TPA: TlpA disulfide reductase family protein [Actinomycetes bacterium]|jgi:thiol-disulfide isomerase/thioredoxin|nr:TlpA disulfide reductase family protein [Actinomycetes bacterium]
MSRRALALGAGGAVLAAIVVVIAMVALTGGGGKGLAPEPAAGQVRPVAPNVTVIAPGDRARLPRLAGETLDGGHLDLASFRGHVLVLNFWASWCGPCRSEQAGLQQAARDLAGQGVRFVGIDVKDQRAAALAYVREFETTYPSLYDPSTALVARLRGQGPAFPPATLVIDEQGRIGARIDGALSGGRASPALQSGLLGEIVSRVRGGKAEVTT